MSNLPIEVPDYNPSIVRYILEIAFYIDDVQKWLSTRPEINEFSSNYELAMSLAGFIYESNGYDPLWFIRHLIQKYPKFHWNRFIVRKSEKISLECHHYSGKERHFHVTYLEIRESIVSYLEQKLEKNDNLDEFKSLFGKKGGLSFDEYLDLKTKQLLDLDLSEYEESLKKPKTN